MDVNDIKKLNDALQEARGIERLIENCQKASETVGDENLQSLTVNFGGNTVSVKMSDGEIHNCCCKNLRDGFSEAFRQFLVTWITEKEQEQRIKLGKMSINLGGEDAGESESMSVTDGVVRGEGPGG